MPGVVFQHLEIDHRRNRYRGFVQRRLDSGRLQRRIAAVGPAEDRHPLGIRDALLSDSQRAEALMSLIAVRQFLNPFSFCQASPKPVGPADIAAGSRHNLEQPRTARSSRIASESRDAGPPCGKTTVGKLFAGLPGGSVR